ncbi:MAG TPA: phosphotransferase family protein [Acidimicrobiales bacterium]|nr:phosphotransferase family protein [Acidimicrobiales bacterium]
MATGHLRDTDQLAAGLATWLATPGSPVRGELFSVSRPSSGYSNETLVVEVATPRRVEKLVVRLPTLEPSFPEYDLTMQAGVHEALSAAGLPVPVPVTVVDDPSWLGTAFLVMPFVEGHVLGEAPMFDRWLMGLDDDAQAQVHDRFVDALASVHRVDWSVAPVATVLRGRSGTLEDELAWWVGYVEWASDGSPLRPLVEGLEWCIAHRPAGGFGRSLLWGDPRLGNVIVGPDGTIRALVDWELASVGPPEMDLAWYLALGDVLASLVSRRVGGFPDRAATVARYEAALGRPTADMAWHEIFALCRSLAISNRQARIAAAAGEAYVSAPDETNPVVPVIAARIAAFG